MNPQDLYLERYEDTLTRSLLRICTEAGALEGQLLETPDLETVWEPVAQPYIADALPEIPDYPTVAVGWMSFVGLAAAHLWETGWAPCAAHPERIYPALRDVRGFDALDDHILDDVLGLADHPEERAALVTLLHRCAETALAALRHEQIEPQSSLAFHAYVRTLHALYRIGAAVELRRQGYHFEKVDAAE